MSKVIGIDLGTTNSCVAIIEAGEVQIILNAEGSRTTPSVVSFDKDGERIVGQLAKRQTVINPDRTVSSIKREMGTNMKIRIDDKEYFPQEIAAMILQKLKADAEAYVGETIEDAIITVPAYFNDSQRQATKDAGKIAGLNVLRIINEPTAAALSYGIQKEESQRILIYDFGGGTFDISILELSDGIFNVIASSGNNHLGGDDIDQLLVNYFAEDFKKKNNIDLRNDKTSFQRLKEASEKAKIELSTMKSTRISLPFITADASGPKHFEAEITRVKFEELITDIVDSTIDLLVKTITDAGFTNSDIDKTLLVGGSTRIPLIPMRIKESIGKETYKGINPDECVAAGAAIQGGIISGTISDLLLLDVTPLSLGLETHGGVFTKLIDRNTTIPIRRTQVFSTVANDQTQVEVHVLQGERDMAIYNKTLGRFILTSIPSAPRGVPQIEVTFDIDVNGIVQVSAKDMSTGNEQAITISSSNNLSDEEIKKAIQDAMKYTEDDNLKREIANVLNTAEATMNNANKILKTYKNNVTASNVKNINGYMDEMTEMVKNEQYKLLIDKTIELKQYLSTVSKNMIFSTEKENEE